MTEFPKNTSERKQKDIENQIQMIEQDRNEMDTLRRFGYFTIPYPATVGDLAYTTTNIKKNYQIKDGKIITENRNVFVAPLKKGKGPDVYFSPVEPDSLETIEKYKELNKKDKKKELEKVQQRKENKAGIVFKPGGPQETFSFYRDIQSPESTGTLYIKPDPKRFIMEGGRVKTENRGIFTNPTHVGIPHPNDYFSFYFADEPTQERIKTLGQKDIKDKLDKVQISDVEREQKLKEYQEYKKKGNPKYSKSLPKGCVKHDRPFAPARLIYIGRDGLFDDNLYTLPEMTEKDKAKLRIKTVKEKKEEEEKTKATRRVPFTYNKLMKISKFAPPISSFTTNLKKEFPTIKFH